MKQRSVHSTLQNKRKPFRREKWTSCLTQPNKASQILTTKKKASQKVQKRYTPLFLSCQNRGMFVQLVYAYLIWGLIIFFAFILLSWWVYIVVLVVGCKLESIWIWIFFIFWDKDLIFIMARWFLESISFFYIYIVVFVSLYCCFDGWMQVRVYLNFYF